MAHSYVILGPEHQHFHDTALFAVVLLLHQRASLFLSPGEDIDSVILAALDTWKKECAEMAGTGAIDIEPAHHITSPEIAKRFLELVQETENFVISLNNPIPGEHFADGYFNFFSKNEALRNLEKWRMLIKPALSTD